MPANPVDGRTYAEAVAQLYRDAELGMLQTLATRLGPGPDDGPAYSVAKLAELGQVRSALATQVLDLTAAARVAVPGALTAAYSGGGALALAEFTDNGLPVGALPPARARALDALARDTNGLLARMAPTILRTVLDVYRRVVSTTVATVTLGALNRRQATQLTLNRFAQQGVTGFVDKAGRNWGLDSYAEMAVRTAAGQAAIQGHTDHLQANGVALVQCSDTPRECPLCREFEGMILSLDGATGPREVEDVLTGRIVTVEVYATVAAARGRGLQHPNCRHNLTAYLPGATPRVRATQDPDGYKASQKQRKIERDIRAAKRVQAAATDPQAKRAAGARVREQQAAMRAHMAANPKLLRRTAREQLRTADAAPPDVTRPREVGPSRPLGPQDMGDDELGDAMVKALDDGDIDGYESLAAISDAREEAAAAVKALEAARALTRAKEAARQRARRASAAESKAEAQGAELDRLLDEGVDPAEATARAYGISIEKVRAQELRAALDTEGFRGSLPQQIRQAYDKHVEQEFFAAEEYARGAELVTAEGRAAGVDARALFTMASEKRATRLATQELRQYWSDHGRVTLAEFRAELMGDPAKAARLRAERSGYDV